MSNGEIRRLQPDVGPPKRAQGGSVFRYHDSRSGLPIPDGRELFLPNGIVLDALERNLDQPRYRGPLPDPVIETTILEPQYLDDGEN